MDSGIFSPKIPGKNKIHLLYSLVSAAIGATHRLILSQKFPMDGGQNDHFQKAFSKFCFIEIFLRNFSEELFSKAFTCCISMKILSLTNS